MSKIKAEYIWIDGYAPTANLRSKTKIVDNKIEELSELPFGVLMVLAHCKQMAMIVTAC